MGGKQQSNKKHNGKGKKKSKKQLRDDRKLRVSYCTGCDEVIQFCANGGEAHYNSVHAKKGDCFLCDDCNYVGKASEEDDHKCSVDNKKAEIIWSAANVHAANLRAASLRAAAA